jgi:hypothetical protein
MTQHCHYKLPGAEQRHQPACRPPLPAAAAAAKSAIAAAVVQAKAGSSDPKAHSSLKLQGTNGSVDTKTK